MSNIRERRVPYLASIVGSLIALLIIHMLDGPESLRCLALFSTIELTLLAIITTFWLISIHATSITAVSILGALVFGWWTLVFLVPLVLLVCLVRLYLRRHTFTQVVAGCALGTVTVLLVVQFGCF